MLAGGRWADTCCTKLQQFILRGRVPQSHYTSHLQGSDLHVYVVCLINLSWMDTQKERTQMYMFFADLSTARTWSQVFWHFTSCSAAVIRTADRSFRADFTLWVQWWAHLSPSSCVLFCNCYILQKWSDITKVTGAAWCNHWGMPKAALPLCTSVIFKLPTGVQMWWFKFATHASGVWRWWLHCVQVLVFPLAFWLRKTDWHFVSSLRRSFKMHLLHNSWPATLNSYLLLQISVLLCSYSW